MINNSEKREVSYARRKKSTEKRKKQCPSLCTGICFVIVEIVMAIYTSSQAVLLDAVYDGVEFVCPAVAFSDPAALQAIK